MVARSPSRPGRSLLKFSSPAASRSVALVARCSLLVAARLHRSQLASFRLLSFRLLFFGGVLQTLACGFVAFGFRKSCIIFVARTSVLQLVARFSCPRRAAFSHQPSRRQLVPLRCTCQFFAGHASPFRALGFSFVRSWVDVVDSFSLTPRTAVAGLSANSNVLRRAVSKQRLCFCFCDFRFCPPLALWHLCRALAKGGPCGLHPLEQ